MLNDFVVSISRRSGGTLNSLPSKELLNHAEKELSFLYELGYD